MRPSKCFALLLAGMTFASCATPDKIATDKCQQYFDAKKYADFTTCYNQAYDTAEDERRALAVLGAAAVVGAAAYAASRGHGVGYAPQCCKVCTVGKACGDTCITVTDQCWVGQGCACNAN